ncbi:AI-2E family transporter [Patescibacteria group bacterium]|nr:MAG: AI-2E family transporter [Patescibacteria group bacterium]
MTPQKGQLYFLAILGLIAAGITVSIFLPFLVTISISAICAVILGPLYRRLETIFGGNKTISALLTLLIAGVILIVPATFVANQVFTDSVGLYNHIKDGGVDGLAVIVDKIESPIQAIFPSFSIDVQKYVSFVFTFFSDNFGNFFSNTAHGVFNLILGIIMLFYFLKDGAKFKKEIVRLSPLADHYDGEILAKLALAVNSVVRGSLFVAIIQGVFVGIGFHFFGVPNATLWATIAAVISLVPGLGTALVIVPSIIYLFFTGNTTGAIGLFVWGVLAVSVIDNILLPVFIGKGFHIHPLLILLSVLGGISIFGPFGFLLGPLFLSLLFTLGDIYKMMVSGTLPKTE